VAVLCIIVFISMLGFGIILPLFPFYAERLGAGPEVITWTMAGFTLGQFVATPLWGRLSDAVGRRPVLVLTVLGSAVSYVVLAFASELWVVIASRVFGGMMAGNVSTALAYVGDVTTEKSRSAGMGKLGAALGMGFIFGPAFGGLLAGSEVETANYVRPALAAAVISLVATFGTLLFVKESLDAAHRKPLFGRREAGSPAQRPAGVNRGALFKLLAVAMGFFTAMSLMESIFPLWANDAFGMGPRNIGGVFFVLGSISAIVQGLLIGRLTDRFSEQRIAAVAGGLFGLGLAILAAAGSSWQVWVGLVPFAVGIGLFNPTVSSLVSKTAAPDARGAVMGQYQAASALGRVVGPGVSGILYAQIGLAAPFTLAAVIMLPVLVLVGTVRLRDVVGAAVGANSFATDDDRG
jgi:DHA1 family tetracycline resistance protein-like MFS transporter